MKTDSLLRAVSKSAAALFRDRDMGRACAGLLCGLGEAAGVSRVYFFENHRGPRGEMLTTQRHEWVAPGVSARRAGGEVVVFVADEGRGIEPGYLEKMFERHFQRYPSEPGTGIGLTLCRKIAESHGGRIWAESGGRGKGLTVRVALPARGAVGNSTPGAR